MHVEIGNGDDRIGIRTEDEFVFLIVKNEDAKIDMQLDEDEALVLTDLLRSCKG